MCNLYDNEEYSFEEMVISEQENFLRIILHGFGLYDVNNIDVYINNKIKLENIDKFELNRIMNNQLRFFLEKGLLKNWEEYFADSIEKRLNDGKEIDMEFFKLTYQTLNMIIQENTCYCGEAELLGYSM